MRRCRQREAVLLALGTLLLAAAPPLSEAALGERVVCYIPDWAVWRPDGCKWSPSQLNTAHCTHVIYSFAFLDASFNPLILDDTSRTTLVPQAAALKLRKPGLKVMLAIGGWSMNEPTSPYRTRWSDAVATAAARLRMINNTMNWLDRNSFDGLDIDWEYPGVAERSGRTTDRAGLAALLAEWKAEAARRGKPYLLSMAAAAYVPNLIGIDMTAAKQHLDFLSIMTYDYHGPWDTATNYMAPWSDPAGGTLDIEGTLAHYINVLAWPKWKLNLGLGLYGSSWTLASGAPAVIGAATAGGGAAQPCTGQAGYAGWREVKALIAAGAQVVVSTAAKHAYVVSGRTFISCDTPATLQMKISAAAALDLGGLMVWEYSLDDADNTLMNLVSAHLPRPSPPPSPSPRPPPPRPRPPPPPNPLNYIRPAPRKRQPRPSRVPGTTATARVPPPPPVRRPPPPALRPPPPAANPTVAGVVPAGRLTVVDRPTVVNAAGLLCGGGRLGNGVCQDSGACCSRWGHCGRSYEHCSLDRGYCVGGACADLSRWPQALAPPINNGSAAVLPNRPGRGRP